MSKKPWITANPALACVPPGHTSAPVQVSYEAAQEPVRVWYREHIPPGGLWDYIRDPNNPGKPIDPMKGSFARNLPPNQVVELELHPADSTIDRNLPNFSLTPLASAVAFAFAGRPPDGKWGIDGPRIDVGGTYAAFTFYTTADVTAVISVSTDAPAENPCRFTTFPASAIVLREQDQNPTKLHAITVEPLLPGTDYHYILETFHKDGYYVMKQGKLTTLRRKISGQVTAIFIEDDGDNTGTGEARITVAVYEGIQPLTPPGSSAVPAATMSEYFDPIDSGKNINPLPNMNFIIGPKPGDFSIVMYATGTEFDGPTEDDEDAVSNRDLKKVIVPPTGQNSEIVVNNSINLRPDITFGSFMFNATISYSITYV